MIHFQVNNLVVIDNVRLEAKLNLPLILGEKFRKKKIRIGKLELNGINSRFGPEIVKYEEKVDNLLFTVKEDKLYISNSLHKFCKWNNHSNFCYSELIRTIQKIEDLTEISSCNFLIKKLEFGINIIPSFDIQSELSSIGDFKGFQPAMMKSGSKSYGVKYYLTEYALKLYDKTFQVYRADRIKLGDKILRVEMEYNKRNKLPKGIVWLEDLKNQINLELFFNELYGNVNQISLMGNENFSGLRPREIEFYFAGLNEQYWNNLRKGSRDTFKSRKMRFKEIQKQATPRDLITEILEKLNIKFEQLLKL